MTPPDSPEHRGRQAADGAEGRALSPRRAGEGGIEPRGAWPRRSTCSLQLLGRTKRVGIDVSARDGSAKIAHVSLHALDEGGGGVLQPVPAVGDLQRLGAPLAAPSRSRHTISTSG